MTPATFVFLLTTWSPETSRPIVDVVQTDISGQECIAAMIKHEKRDPMNANGIPSCEVDNGKWTENLPPEEYAVCSTEACLNPIILPACPTEDSDDCFWDARWRGNGKGQSFYVVAGVVTNIDLEEL